MQHTSQDMASSNINLQIDPFTQVQQGFPVKMYALVNSFASGSTSNDLACEQAYLPIDSGSTGTFVFASSSIGDYTFPQNIISRSLQLNNGDGEYWVAPLSASREYVGIYLIQDNQPILTSSLANFTAKVNTNGTRTWFTNIEPCTPSFDNSTITYTASIDNVLQYYTLSGSLVNKSRGTLSEVGFYYGISGSMFTKYTSSLNNLSQFSTEVLSFISQSVFGYYSYAVIDGQQITGNTIYETSIGTGTRFYPFRLQWPQNEWSSQPGSACHFRPNDLRPANSIVVYADMEDTGRVNSYLQTFPCKLRTAPLYRDLKGTVVDRANYGGYFPVVSNLTQTGSLYSGEAEIKSGSFIDGDLTMFLGSGETGIPGNYVRNCSSPPYPGVPCP
jgi:hypothetical protein